MIKFHKTKLMQICKTLRQNNVLTWRNGNLNDPLHIYSIKFIYSEKIKHGVSESYYRVLNIDNKEIYIIRVLDWVKSEKLLTKATFFTGG